MPPKKRQENKSALLRRMRQGGPRHTRGRAAPLESVIDATAPPDQDREVDDVTSFTICRREEFRLLTEEEKQQIAAAHKLHESKLSIPRKPAVLPGMSKEMLHASEAQSFHEWRSRIHELVGLEGLTLTPFEKNLDVWRQLWRTLEKSDVVIQIVDARNPLLFRCRDLEAYVREVDPRKVCLLLVNKADHLTAEQRRGWARHFNAEGTRAVFFSALNSTQGGLPLHEEESGQDSAGVDSPGEEEDSTEGSLRKGEDEEDSKSESPQEQFAESGQGEGEGGVQGIEEEVSRLGLGGDTEDEDGDSMSDPENVAADNSIRNSEITEGFSSESDQTRSKANHKTSSKLYNREELLKLLTEVCPEARMLGEPCYVGMVGYPNVGKSSTVNCLLDVKKVRVSATPGKTKIMQTHHLRNFPSFISQSPESPINSLVLVDCPGLVFPGFVSTREDMILWGILPIDRLRQDYGGAIATLCHTLPPAYLEAVYSLPPFPGVGRPPSNEELLFAYGVSRGFFASGGGRPDIGRSARCILKDFMHGRLLRCVAPPGLDQAAFHAFPTAKPRAFVLTQRQRAYLPEGPEAAARAADEESGLVEEPRAWDGRGARPNPRRHRQRKPRGARFSVEQPDGSVAVVSVAAAREMYLEDAKKKRMTGKKVTYGSGQLCEI